MLKHTVRIKHKSNTYYSEAHCRYCNVMVQFISGFYPRRRRIDKQIVIYKDGSYLHSTWLKCYRSELRHYIIEEMNDISCIPYHERIKILSERK